MTPIDPGNPECTSGLSKELFTNWTNDPQSGWVLPIEGPNHTSVKAMCYQFAKTFAEAFNTAMEL